MDEFGEDPALMKSSVPIWKWVFVVSLGLLFFSCGETEQHVEEEGAHVWDGREPEVYICTGSSSYAYHDHYCQGLKQCRHEVNLVQMDEALRIGRKPCGYCY